MRYTVVYYVKGERYRDLQDFNTREMAELRAAEIRTVSKWFAFVEEVS